ncbi:hypothetical protein [Sutterella sp.]|uniref:autotransporter outer membrane beta-barrel domain-containing protein n=1 Tax=Sutterella sp. TaxID=1981025 RepID=UPI0026DEDD07|nr:hypothetical protein [Sutterella sp.]MDO5531631.1 hypothetical protein [Sutterella sp.]
MSTARKFSLAPLALALALALPSAAPAYTYIDVYGVDGSVWARLAVADQADNERENFFPAYTLRDLTALELQAIRDAVLHWSDVLGPVAQVPVITVLPIDFVYDNAGAQPDIIQSTGETALSACIRGTGPCSSDLYTYLWLYSASSWRESEVLSLNPLPAESLGFNLSAVVLHEFLHELGMFVWTATDEEGRTVLAPEATTVYSLHLVDLYGTSAGDASYIETRSQADISAEHDASVFYVLSDNSIVSGVKFTGENVTEVIGEGTVIFLPDVSAVVENADGTYSLAEATLTNSVTGGLPVLGVEGETINLSHIELQNSLMSHQDWRNWQVPLEVELAMLQDLGYTFDRKRFFGTSIYASGTETTITQAFTARENYAWTSSPSTQSYAVGVHVYGSLNTVTVAADQLADGAESFGVRVDGEMNSVTIASGTTVTANGTNGTGVAFTYGRGHTLSIEAGATVSAAGTGGKALAFDFGGNAQGNTTEYRGSYLYGYYDGEDSLWRGIPDLPSALDGALMDEVNVAGTLSAPDGYAIYIAGNAHVATINILSGASVTGDIVSLWNAQSEIRTVDSVPCLVARANIGDESEYRVATWIALDGDEIPDITTNLVLGDSEDFDFTYSGNITGADGLRVTFAAGTSSLSGTFSVLGAVVQEGAAAMGEGTWTLTAKESEDVYARVSDEDFVQGAFVNNGELWSASTTGLVTITGDYAQGESGTLVLGVNAAGETTQLTVSGTTSGTLAVELVPEAGYWADGTEITVATDNFAATTATSAAAAAVSFADDETMNGVSRTLTVSGTESGGSLTGTVSRRANAYSNLLGSSATSGQRAVAAMFDANAGNATDANAQTLVAAIDYSDAEAGAAVMGDLTGDAHLSAVRAEFAVERLLDRTLSRAPANPAVSGRHVWAQPFGGRLADNTAGSHSRTKAAGLAGGVTVTEPGQEIGWQMAAAYFSESNNLHAKTRGQGLWLGASGAKAFDGGEKWWFDLSGRIGLANVKTERCQTVIGSSQEVKGTRLSASLAGRIGPRLEVEDVLSVRPAVGLIGTVLRTPSKTEDKFGGLGIDDAWYRSLRAQVGVAAETAPIESAFTGFSWKWTANAAYERELLQDAGEFRAGIAGMNGTFSQRVDWNDRNRWIIGGGLELANEKGFTAAVRLEGEMTHGDGAAVTGGAELRWQF